MMEIAVVYKRNIDEMDWAEMGHGERFHNERKMLTPMQEDFIPKVGCSLFRLQPGKRSFPLHEHLANDEAIIVTKGTGTLRYGEETYILEEGDYVHLPAASGHAHHMINTGHEPLEYFCISSTALPEIVLYPESKKLGAIAYTASKPGEARSRMASFLKHEPVNYWEGEKED
jgi:uncharacterized cupin superfamily protein